MSYWLRIGAGSLDIWRQEFKPQIQKGAIFSPEVERSEQKDPSNKLMVLSVELLVLWQRSLDTCSFILCLHIHHVCWLFFLSGGKRGFQNFVPPLPGSTVRLFPLLLILAFAADKSWCMPSEKVEVEDARATERFSSGRFCIFAFGPQKPAPPQMS